MRTARIPLPGAPVARRACRLLPLLLLAGCGDQQAPVLRATTPANGATAVSLQLQPSLTFNGDTTIDASDRGVVLYDVTGGGRLTVAGRVEVDGATLRYVPDRLLDPDRDYQLRVEQKAVGDGTMAALDESERPMEPVAWPFRLRFSTRAYPRVRAAYLDLEQQQRPVLDLRFSQAMDRPAVNRATKVLDSSGQPLATETPLWLDAQQVQIALAAPLEQAQLYTLLVGPEATAQNMLGLDGNANGVPAEGDSDAARASFTGSQQIIVSRLAD